MDPNMKEEMHMSMWKRILAAAAVCTTLTVVPAYAEEPQTEPAPVEETTQAGEKQPDGTENQAGGVIQQVYSRLETYSMKTSQLDKFDYLLYTPKNAQENLPLIVFLHGHGTYSIGELENDVSALKRTADKKTSAAYMLAPLLPPKLNQGAKGMWPGIDASVMELLEAVVTDHQIDRNRIYIVGGSMGADSAIQLIAAHPDTFAGMAGIVPFHYKCPIRKWEKEWGELFKTVPTWLFIEDEGSAKQMAQTTVDDIIQAGGQAWVEVQEGADHGSAGQKITAYKTSAIYDWLLTLSRQEEN